MWFLIQSLVQALENHTASSSVVCSISPFFLKNIPKNIVHILLIYNWIDTNQIYPKNRKDNKLFDDLNISREEFVVSYCGNLGVPQNVEIMIDAAEKLKEIP